MKKSKLSQTETAKKLRSMRKNETPKQKRERLDKRNAALNKWKARQKRMSLEIRKKSREAKREVVPAGGLFFIEQNVDGLTEAAQLRYDAMAREIRHLMHVHNGLLKFSNPHVQVMCIDLERTIDGLFRTINAFLEHAPVKGKN